jgi:hypothetical protein
VLLAHAACCCCSRCSALHCCCCHADAGTVANLLTPLLSSSHLPPGSRNRAVRKTLLTHAAARSCLLMGDLQAAIEASAPDAADSRHSRRGHNQRQALLAAREAQCLAAQFRLRPHPDSVQLEQLALLTVIPCPRLSKFFNNQRHNSKKRKTAAPTHGGDYTSRIEALLQWRPDGEREAAVTAAASAAGAAAAEPLDLPADPSSVSQDEINAELWRILSGVIPLGDMPLAAAPAASSPAASDSASSTSTKLDAFSSWLQQRQIDPFTCARRCHNGRLALLVEHLGRHSHATSLLFAGACVLRAAFEQCEVDPPASLSAWKMLLADSSQTAQISRQSDLLWSHLRPPGAVQKAFCVSVPTKAREDTLTALAIIAAIAPHDKRTNELVSVTPSTRERVQSCL